MRCTACHGPVAFERTVFRGTTPATVRLCAPCADRIDVMSHIKAIKAAPDHAAKTQAVEVFLDAVQACEAAATRPGD